MVHRAIPYPVLLFTSQEEDLTFSLCHKRWSLGESGKVVLDGDLIEAALDDEFDSALVQSFRESLPLAKQKRTDLFALYESWIGCIVALAAAKITGRFLFPDSPSRTSAMHSAVEDRVPRPHCVDPADYGFQLLFHLIASSTPAPFGA